MDPQAAPLLWLLAGALVVVGIVGTVVPFLPGAPLVFAGLLLGAWIDGFHKVGAFTLAILATLTIFSILIDLFAAGHGAKRAGASPLAVFGAAVGTVVGLFFSLPGLLLGPFLGAFAGELLWRRNLRQAGRAGLGTWLGLIASAAAQLALIFAMLGVFATSYLL